MASPPRIAKITPVELIDLSKLMVKNEMGVSIVYTPVTIVDTISGCRLLFAYL